MDSSLDTVLSSKELNNVIHTRTKNSRIWSVGLCQHPHGQSPGHPGGHAHTQGPWSRISVPGSEPHEHRSRISGQRPWTIGPWSRKSGHGPCPSLILEHSACILKHSGTFWNILDVVEGCRKVYVQVDDRQTDRQTDTQTLGLVELRLRS